MIVNDDDSLIDPHKQGCLQREPTDFAQMIIDTLRVAGVQQAHKEDSITLNPSMVGLEATSLARVLTVMQMEALKHPASSLALSSAPFPALTWWKLHVNVLMLALMY